MSYICQRAHSSFAAILKETRTFQLLIVTSIVIVISINQPETQNLACISLQLLLGSNLRTEANCSCYVSQLELVAAGGNEVHFQIHHVLFPTVTYIPLLALKSFGTPHFWLRRHSILIYISGESIRCISSASHGVVERLFGATLTCRRAIRPHSLQPDQIIIEFKIKASSQPLK